MTTFNAINQDNHLVYTSTLKSDEHVQSIVPKLDVDVNSHQKRGHENGLSGAQQAIAIAKGRAHVLREQTVTLVKHPKFQTIALGGGSGLVIMGPTCCFIGGGAGIAIGTAIGCVPALFTFGLSIPVGAVIGGAVGSGLGLAAGGGGGLIVGGAAGHVGHAYRAEIKNGLLYIKTTTGERVVDLRLLCMELVERTKSKACQVTDSARVTTICAHQNAMRHTINFGKNAHSVVVHPKFQATAASAAGGAVVGGASGGAAGLVTGGTIGAAVGVLPALFTFGLSIPIGAAVGGGAGLCIGTAAGTTTGAAGGGAAGYTAHSYRNEIRSGASSVWTTATTYASMAKAKVAGRIAGTA